MHYLKLHKTPLYSLAILLLAILTAPAALAQTPPCSNPTTVTIGNGTGTNSYLGGYSYYKYSFTEQIYQQSEITDAATIFGMKIQMGSTPSPSRQIDIYLGHTEQTSVPEGWIVPNDLTLVWSGPANYTANSWNTYTFTTPFHYNSTANLLLVIVDHTGNYNGSSSSSSNKVKTHTNGNNVSRYAYSDNTIFSTTNLPTSSNSTRYSTTDRMNVQWLACGSPCGSIQNLTVSSIGTNSAFINWTLANPSSSTQVTLQYADNPNFTSSQSVTVTSDPPYALTGLDPNTTYYVRVGISCSEETTVRFSETSFTTDPMPCAEYNGSSTITIGNGTGTETHLWGAYLWNYSFSEQIYRHSELGGAVSITGMAVQLANAGRERHLLIYLGHTSQSSVDSWIMPSDLTLVWSGTTAYTANSWNEVPFNAPFQYNGTDNLLLLIVDESGYWGGGETSARIHDNTGYYSRYIYSDNDTYSASSLPSGTGTSLQKRANVRWYFDNCITPADCDIPAVIVEDVGEQSAVVRWTDVNAAPYRVYISTGNATPTLMGTTSDTSYTLNGLEGNTTYQVRIHPQCTGATTEPYASAQFTTPLCNGFTTIAIPQNTDNSTTNSYLWGRSFFYNAFTEQIYRHEEMNGAVNLIGMSIHVGAVEQDRQISIYLGHTEQTSVPNNWIIPDDLTQVWSGTTDYTAQNWNDINFDTPFEYNGTDNLLLVLVDHNDSYSSSAGNNTFVHDNGNYSSRYAYADNTIYSITSPPASSTAISKRMNVRWMGCASPCGNLQNLTVSDIGANSATINWTTANQSPNSQVVLEYADNPNFTSSQSVTVTSAPPFLLTGLEPLTTYYIRANIICDEGSSSFASAQFSTPLCDEPNIQTIGNGTTTTPYLWGNSEYNRTFSQQIYRQSELGIPRTLYSMDIQVGAAGSNREISIYLGHTNLNSVPQGWIVPEDLTLVWSGTTHYTPNSWNHIIFNTPFAYNGEDNLLLVFVDHTGSSESAPNNTTILHRNGNYHSRYIYGNNTTYNAFSPPHISSTVTASYYRMNVRWYGCIDPCGAIQNLTVSDIDVNSATLNWTVYNPSSTAQVTLEYADNPNFTSSQSITVTGNPPFTLTNLEPNTTYYVRVHLDCAEGAMAGFASTHFSTPIQYIIIDDIDVPEELCGGTSEQIVIGFSSDNGITIQTPKQTLGYYERVFLPDGTECEGTCYYLSSVTFDAFPEEATISSVEDIEYIRVNLEHSWIGDLYMAITCPNGNSVSLMNYSGGNTTSECYSTVPTNHIGWTGNANYYWNADFGIPVNSYSTTAPCNPNATGNAPGIGWNYCWSENTSYEYAPSNALIYGASTSSDIRIDSSNVSAGTNFYHPNQSFSDLIGCPLNGTWSIEVIDASNEDNGYIFGWDMTLSSSMVANNLCPIQEILLNGPYVNRVNDTIFTIDVPSDLAEEETAIYSLSIITSCGFQIDTSITIQLHPSPSIIDVQKHCDSYTWNGVTYTESTNTPTYHSFTAAGCDSNATLNLTINPSYNVTDNQTKCDSYEWNGTTYTQSTTQTATLISIDDCDSVVTLNLTINHNAGSEETLTACDSYTWPYMADPLTSSDVYEVSYTDDNGCEGIHKLNLTIHPSYNVTDNQTSCVSYTWNGTTYTQSTVQTATMTAENGCDSIVTLNLTIHPSYNVTDNQTACVSYTWNGTTYTQSTVQTATLTSINGCDSTVTLHLTIHPSYTITDNQTACDSYIWNGSTYTQSTVQTATLTSTEGCDSTVTLNLTIHPSYNVTDNQTACVSYTWNGTTYTQSTVQTATMTAANGCDSTVTLNLTIHPSYNVTDNQTACVSYAWNGTTYTQSTVQTATLTSINGCDSTVTLHLTIHPSYTITDNQTACDSYIWNGSTYTQSTVQTATLTSTEGCDSTVTLNLTIYPSYNVTDNQTACVSYTWNGTTYTQSTVQTATLTAANGCDSTVTLNLTIHPSYNVTDNQTACVSYTWNGTTYTQSTVQTATLTSINGCDSVVTLHLTILPSYTITDNQTACDSYTWNGSTYTQSTVQTATLTSTEGCDSTVTLNLTIHPSYNATDNQTACDSYSWQGTNYSQSTIQTITLTAANSCDSTVTLHLTVNYSTSGIDEQTVCDSLRWHGTLYTNSTNQPTYHTTNAAGCDSTTTLHLTVNHHIYAIDEQNVCDSLVWHNNTYYSSTIRPTYNSTSSTGCDSTTTLHLTVRYSSSGIDEQNVCDSYSWHGTTYTQSTDTPIFLSTNAAGCDSTTTLHLTVRYSNSGIDEQTACDSYSWHGTTYTTSTNTPTYQSTNAARCDSTTTLHLTVNYSTSSIDEQTVCDSLRWHGALYTNSTNQPTYHTTNAAGCDSTTTLHLTVNHHIYAIDEQNVCDSLTWHGNTYYSSTIRPTYNSTSSTGCDSTTTLHLTVRYSSSGIDEQNVCDSYSWHGTTYTQSTDTPIFLSTNAAGCDSTTTLHLTVRHSTSGIDEQTACNNYSWHGVTYTSSTNTPTHQSTNAEGCDSTTTLHLTINHSTSSIDEQSVCDSLVWHGRTYHNTTNRPTYQSTNAAGCDSTVTLHLTVRHSTSGIDVRNACDSLVWHGTVYRTSTNSPIFQSINAEGCDSTVTLHLTVHGSTSAIDERDVCDSLTWHGTTYTASTQTPIFHSSNAAGCDSTTTLHLTVRHSTSSVDVQDVCDRLRWHGTIYTTSTTTPTYHSTNTAGCDSTVTLHLTVRHSTNGVDEQSVCDSLTWHGTTYRNSTNQPTYQSTNAAGCDSTTTLHLTVRHSNSGIEEQTVCDSLMWHGTVYRNSTNNPIFQSTNAEGCDSITTLHLTVNYSSSGIDVQDVCDELTWHGTTYTQSTDTPTFHSTNAAGCDSTTTLHLTVRHSSQSTETFTVCDSMEWHGTVYRNSTSTATYQSTNAEGCDSIVTLHLTVNHSTHDSVSTTACEQYTWHGETFDTNGIHRYDYTDQNGCESSETLYLRIVHGSHDRIEETACGDYRWHQTDYTESGVYTYDYNNADGCASTDTLYLTVLEISHSDTSAATCVRYFWQRSGMTYTESGVYVYDYNNEVGCPSHDTLHLTIFDAYNQQLYDTICEGERIRFADEIYDSSGDYTAQLQSIHGCDSTVTLHLFVRSRPQVEIEAEYGCPTEQWELKAITEAELITWTANTGNHQLNGHEHDTVVRFHAQDTTLMTLTADYATGHSCPNNDQVTLKPIVKVTALIECRPEVLSQERPEIEARDISSGNTARQWYVDGVAWGNDPVITCTADKMADEMILLLIVNNEYCADTTERILVSTNESIFIPNIFTPTQSINSTFRAHGSGILEFKMSIYNREGLLVFSSNDISTEWDGTHNGEPCPQGSYVYQIRFRGRSVPDGWQTRTGAIMLLR